MLSPAELQMAAEEAGQCWVCSTEFHFVAPARVERELIPDGCDGPICTKCADWLDAFEARLTQILEAP